MSEKSKNTENLNDSKSQKEELSTAEKMLQKINKLKEDSTFENEEKIEKEKFKEELENNENTPISSEKESVESNKVDTDKENPDIEKEDDKKEELVDEESKKNVEEVVDYSEKSKEELINIFTELLTIDDTTKYSKKIKSIRNRFYEIVKEEDQQRKDKFIEDEGNIDDYKPVKDEYELKFEELFQKFINKKDTWEIKINNEKKNNLELKYQIIKEIEELVNKPETFNKTFNKFKELQKRWNNIGIVPKNDVKDLFDEYNKNVQKFYDYLEVNKELRELDFKKNLDKKISFCEQAEELLLETNYSKAKKQLQILHKKWKETGSVSNENREEIWNRFQAATIKINEKFSEYIEEIKVQQEKNLESKQFLVSKAKEYAEGEYTNHKEWKDASNNVIELQKLWKKIGYVPKEHNNEVYNQFKTQCDVFFEKIREYYDENEKHRDDNYQKKLDLCTQAESFQESNEWNNTTEIYKNIQIEWKKIGPVPRKYSDEIWKRFRKACNTFFDRKKNHFKNKKVDEKENLELKQKIIKDIIEFSFSDNQIEDLKKLKEFQTKFNGIGYVPFDKKDEIYEQYHNSIDTQLGKLNISKEKQNELKFDENIEIIKNSPGSDRIAIKEISKLQKQIDKLEDDIKIWENNIGFFANSKKSESMINNINEKVDSAKNKVSILKKNIKELENLLN